MDQGLGTVRGNRYYRSQFWLANKNSLTVLSKSAVTKNQPQFTEVLILSLMHFYYEQ